MRFQIPGCIQERTLLKQHGFYVRLMNDMGVLCRSSGLGDNQSIIGIRG
jgi:hypothetical protein